MNDKTSQRTQEEVLDQTFDSYQDNSVTVEELETAPPAADPAKAKKNNQNLYIFGGVGALGVLGAAYFLLGDSGQPVAPMNPPENPPVVQQPPVVPVEQAQVPVAPNPQLPEVNPFNAPQINQQPTQVTPAVPDFNAGQFDGGQFNPNNLTPNIVQPTTPTLNPNVPNVAEIPAGQPQVALEAPVAQDVQNISTPVNNSQQELVQQLRLMFEEQTREIKSSVDKVGDRVSEVEKAIVEQKDINKSIEERLAKLEAGEKTGVRKASASNNVSTTTVRAKAPVRKAPVRKARAPIESTDDLLVDKSSQRAAIPVVPTYQDIQIHSVYAGRVWTKNKDGSLSTYSAGERLSTGEIIRRIDDEKAQIHTDKRIIR